jgi:hypothetical protein
MNRFHTTSKHKRVYEKAHRIREDVTLQHRELKATNKDMENHPYLDHSKQKTEIGKAHVLHHESSFLHVTRERKRERERCLSLGSQRVSW